MHVSSPRVRPYWILLPALTVVVALTQAQTAGPPRASQTADALVRQVRAALGHGDPDEAQRLAGAAAASPAREVATALIELYRGADDAAKSRLQALVDKGTRGEAALELGLLELRYHHRDIAMRLLDPLTRQNLTTPDDYFLLARAARGIRENKLANDAYDRIATSPRADVFAERGDLFLQYHQYGDAVTEYQNALKRDPQRVSAHLGLSRALAQEEPEAAADALEDARKIAPESPDVWLLTAERALEAEDATAVRTALDHVARARPRTVQEEALRAGVGYLERKPADIDAAIARLKAIDPLSTLGYRTAGQEAARKYRFADAAEYARKAVGLDPDDAAAQAELGLYLLRTGDETPARVALESSWARDKSDVVTKNLLEMLDQLDKFEVVTDGDLVYKFARDEAAVLKPYALPLGQLAYKTFADRYGFKPGGPILIEVFPRHDDFAVRTVGLMGITGALGASFGRVVTMDSPKARPPGDFSWQATLWHEMAHVFTLQLSEYRVPRWLTEGLSVYEEHRRVPAWGRELTLEFARNLASDKTFGVKKLPDAFKHPETLSLAYFEASLLVEHLSDIAGDQGVRTLLRAYADGANDTEAFSRAFGKNIDAVEASFAAFVKQRYGALSAAMADPPGAKVDASDVNALRTRATAAPGSFIAQLSLGRALLQSGDYAGARPSLERAAQLAPQALGNTSPHALLADIAEHDKDNDRARKELRELLTYDHTNVAAARRLAKLAAQSQATEDQDAALRLVADLDPFDVEVHSALGKRELVKGRKAEAVTEFQAALALRPPNLAEAHTDLGEALLAVGRRDDARKEALLALQEAPSFSRAQDLLLAASGRH
jgi:tetratricopeptide (TPR) repeat protein